MLEDMLFPTVLLTTLLVTFKNDKPNRDHHAQEFKDIICDVEAIDEA
jgi:hypothetical protein